MAKKPAPPASTPPAPPRGHRVLRLRVRGGFLSGLDLTFSPHLNCVIGARGTGKTTILELLRFALLTKPLAAMDEDFRELIKANLKDGALTLDVETKDGRRYTIERTQHGQPSVTDEQGQSVRFDLALSGIFDVDAVGQNQIEAVAKSTDLQLELLDRVEHDRVRALKAEIVTAEGALKANAARILGLRAECEGLVEDKDTREGLQQRLDAIAPPSGADAARVKHELELRNQRTRETSAAERLVTTTQTHREALKTAAEALSPPALPAEAEKWPNKAALEAGRVAAAAFAERARQTLDELQAEGSRVAAQLAGTKATLSNLHEAQEAACRDLLKRHEQEKSRADERLALEAELLKLDERQQLLADRKRPISEHEAERRRLREKLDDLREQLSRVREEVAKRLDLSLAPKKKEEPRIRVALHAQSGKAAYQALLKSALGRAEQTIKAILTLPPQRFADLVQAGTVEQLADALELAPRRAGEVIESLKDKPAIYEIDACGFEDVPKIALEHPGGQPKDARSLSTGQRCTTILPILLHEGPKPLLIDQPEDHIDNEYASATLVKAIERVKAIRQLIFVTHNPNIPVLGMAEVVAVLDGDDTHAKLKVPPANVDTPTIKDEVERVLEGGADAFLKRKKLYGH